MKTHIFTGVILSTIALVGLAGCGSGGGSSDNKAPSVSSSSLAGGHLVTYTPVASAFAASGLQSALRYSLASVSFSGGIPAAATDPIRFNLRLEDDGSGNYSGSYSDDSGLISDSVSGTRSRLVVDFGDDSPGRDSQSVTDPELHRHGKIILTNASLDASRHLEAEIEMSIGDRRSGVDVTDPRGRGRGRGNSTRTSDDSSSSSSSSDSSSSTSDAARIPGDWQVVGPASYINNGEILVLKADGSVGRKKDHAVTALPGATYVYTPGPSERLIITIADRKYDMTDVKKRATAATGTVTYDSRTFPVGLRKL